MHTSQRPDESGRNVGVGSQHALQAALDVQSALLSHVDLRSAGAALVHEIAARLGYDRVSLGLLRGMHVQVLAISNVPAVATPTPLVERLGAAMAEALDQRASLLLPEGRANAQPRITLALRRLAEAPGASAAAVPVVAAGCSIGVLCVERFGSHVVAPADLEALEHIACIAGPTINLMRLNERPLRERVSDSMRRWRQALRQPRNTMLRWTLIGATLTLAGLTMVPAPLHIGGHARLEGAVQRVLVAPADGFLRQVHVRPGDSVRAGQALIELAEQDLQLEARRWQSQIAQYENAYAAANARADRAQMVISLSRAAEAEAQLALVSMKLARAHIEAPFDGVVIRGDLSQSLGAPVQQGAELMTIAPRDRFRVIVEVDERDIAAVQAGQPGSLALSALPWDTVPIRLKRITPMASALEGRNVFEVEAELLQQPADLRPGLQGTARIVAGRQPLLWSWSRRLVDALRLVAWRWFG